MTRLAARRSTSDGDVTATERLLKITVLSGGPSSEREVSLKSGAAVAEALRSLGYDVHIADIAPDRLEALDTPADVVFIALHGAFGEDGTLQRILDQRGIVYSGSGAEASALAMDKAETKQCFIHAGIPTPAFDLVDRDNQAKILESWSLPAVVKPLAGGSSVDCFVCGTHDDIGHALQRLIHDEGVCLIERFIHGREMTVSILDDRALPPIEIRTLRPFYDYQAKYLDNETQYLFEIDVPEETIARLQHLSLKAHRALGCRDFSRVDWMLCHETGEPYALEVNTIPGFTDHSLLPKAAARAGLSFPELCRKIVLQAWKNRGR